jgi:3-dehydroquinate synthase
MHAITVPLGPASYTITVGDGVLSRLPELLTTACPAGRYAILSDSTVGDLYGERVAALVGEAGPVDVFRFPAGEWNKTREHWQALTDTLLAAGFSRDAAIVALGGGVTGDLAGFVAATYLRGVPWVQVPTSLLAMLDSSIGGKTGVDTPQGKNLVGAFHQPRAVLADVALLGTLPDAHVRAGLAEAVKHGAIADRSHFERIVALGDALLARDADALLEVVAASVAIKASVVGEDERDRGRRAILNFGHTVAHALEAVSRYALLHGEAVAIGMDVEAALGEAVGVTRSGTHTSLRAALTSLGLPTEVPHGTPQALHAFMGSDKKNRAGAVRFALLREIGQAARSESGEWSFPVAAEPVLAALAHQC